jgi:hypothetical protein
MLMRSRVCFLVLLALMSLEVQAKVFVVDSALDAADHQPGDGVCADAKGLCTLRAAIQESNAIAGADEIWLQPWSEAAPITYWIDIASIDANEDHAARGDLDIRDSVTLRRHPSQASGLVEIGTIANDQGDRIFDVQLPSPNQLAQFQDLLIAGGNLPDPSADGAGMRVGANSRVLMRRVVFYANFGHGFGTALSVHGQAELLDSLVFDNHHFHTNSIAVGGGTIYVAAGGRLQVNNAVIDGNRMRRGGALFVDGAGARADVSRTVFGNSVDIVATAGGQARLENVTLFGGVWVVTDTEAQVDLVHSTLSRGVSGFPLLRAEPSSRIRLRNSIVDSKANAPANCSAPPNALQSLGGNVIRYAAPCAMPLLASDRVVPSLMLTEVRAAPPMRVMPNTFHYALAPIAGSPALDAADPAGCPAVDQFGTARSADRCDSGAIEGPWDPIFSSGFESIF